MGPPRSSAAATIRELTLGLPGSAGGSAELTRLLYREKLGQPFHLELDFTSPAPALDPGEMLGHGLDVGIVLPDGGMRHLHALVSEVSRLDGQPAGGLFSYRVVAEPWLGLLRLRRWSRWFHRKHAIEILEAVFKATGQSAYENLTLEPSPSRDFCAQFGETDLDFVQRTMQRDGIYHFWRHARGGHTLVLCDSFANHGPFPGAGSLPYDPDPTAAAVGEFLTSWSFRHSLTTEAITSDDYHYESAATSPAATEKVLGVSSLSGSVEYRFPAGVTSHAEAVRDARLRGEILAAEAAVHLGTTNSLKVSAGFLVHVDKFPAAGENGDYLVTSATLEIDAAGDDEESRGFTHRCTFEAIPAARQFRPRRTVEKPRAVGMHPAFVHAPDGHPAWQPYSDVSARLQVTTPWNRGGDPSCWVRVSQLLAGDRWGALHLGRAGNEVLVAYEHDDIDRPVIVGCVYNSSNRPPVDMPLAAGISIIKDPSGNYVSLNPIPAEPTITISSPWKATSVMIGGSHSNESSIGLGALKHEAQEAMSDVG